MKNVTILIFFFLLAFACTKKEPEKVVEPTVEKPVLKEEIKKTETTNQLIFTVQIAALKNKNEQLSNLENIRVYQENSLNKYRLGSFATYNEAKKFRNQIIDTYKGAFVQALKNNEPISITEALKN